MTIDWGAIALVISVPLVLALLSGVGGFATAAWLEMEEGRLWAGAIIVGVVALGIGIWLGSVLAPGDLSTFFGAACAAWIVIGLPALGVQSFLHKLSDRPIDQTLRTLRAMDTIYTDTASKLQRLGEEHTRQRRDTLNRTRRRNN